MSWIIWIDSCSFSATNSGCCKSWRPDTAGFPKPDRIKQ
jgi:hypothetical protein